MKKYPNIYPLLMMIVLCISCRGRMHTDLPKDSLNSEKKGAITYAGPHNITRNIIQDRKGNIWIAAFDGIFRYDGKSFTNITKNVTSARFFSVLEDRKGNFWFGSVGSGVYYYDGKSFRNFTTKDGIAGNEVACIYEDKMGNIWFGSSRYDGTSFRNFTTKDGLSSNDINAITEDKTGNIWFATRGNTFVYDGKTFAVLTRENKPFNNVRSLIEDKKGNIWLGGSDGLWRYDGSTFTNFTRKFVSNVMDDKKGNIWFSSEDSHYHGFALFSYDGKSMFNDGSVLSRFNGNSLSYKKPTVTEIRPKAGMICGILAATDGRIWFCGSNGVYRYDGNTITDFKNNEVRE